MVGRGGGDRTHDPGPARHNSLSNAVLAQSDSKFHPLRTIMVRTVEDFVLVFSTEDFSLCKIRSSLVPLRIVHKTG
jgi:hypothetical protein